MIPFLLASAISCSDAEALVDSARKARGLDTVSKEELIEVIKANSEESCWDAND